MSSRLVIAGYAVIAYGTFLLSAVWAIRFLAGGVDGPATLPAWAALTVDGALLAVFAVQHSVMARAGFKRRLTRILPPSAERSTYVLASSLALFALFGWWQPAPAVLWHTGSPWSAPIWLVYAAGWVLVVASTFMIDHADFLGLKQAFRPAHRPPPFTERWLYAWCRHPMMLGLVVTFWATPHMTAGHLFFAGAATGYIAVGIRFEERDLRAQLGPAYEEYATRVPALLPVTLRARPAGAAEPEPGACAARTPDGAAETAGPSSEH